MTTQPVILYVEDDPNSRRIMSMLLSKTMKLSHFVIFEDSSNFVERVAALDPHPDIVFLDIHVKPYSGFQMLSMLRQMDSFANTPIIALTASVMNEEIDQLKTCGFHSVIAKPVDIDTFPDLVNRILNGEEIWGIIE